MFKTIVEDIIFILIIGVVLYVVYKKWLAGWLSQASETLRASAVRYNADVKTVLSAASDPAAVVDDLFKSTTPYISQEQFRANIAEIQRNLAGKQ